MATDKLKKCSPSSSAGDTAAKRLGISRTAWLHLAAGELLEAGDDADEGQPRSYVTAITQKSAGSCNLEPRLLGGGRPK